MTKEQKHIRLLEKMLAYYIEEYQKANAEVEKLRKEKYTQVFDYKNKVNITWNS